MPRAALLRALLCMRARGDLSRGCASLPFFGSPDANAGSEPPRRPQVALYQFEVDAPEPLASCSRPISTWRASARRPRSDAITVAELDRLAAAAPAQARALLETEGYFNATVTCERSTDANGTPRVRLAVMPGPRTLVRDVALEANGAARRAAQADARRRGASRLAAAAVLAAPPRPAVPPGGLEQREERDPRQLRPTATRAATWQRPQAQVDAARQRGELRSPVDSGPLFRLGAITVEGLSATTPTRCATLATLRARHAVPREAAARLPGAARQGSACSRALGRDRSRSRHAGAAPVTVKVKEQTLQQATLGLGYSANTGPRVTLDHRHRRSSARAGSRTTSSSSAPT